MTSKTDRKGQTINYVYDALNRLTRKLYPDSTEVNYVYDLVGKIQQVNDPTGTYAFAYDNDGRLIGTTTTYSFLPSRTFTTSNGYDAASNRTSFTDPENGTTNYTYDTLNRLAGLTPPSAFTTGSFGFSYDTLSRRTQMTRPNSVVTNYSYDSLSRLQSVLHQLSGSTIDGAAYTLDNAGNRTARMDQRTAVATNYGYDNIYQLLSATQGATTTESYTYDSVGNRLSDLTTSGWSNNTSNELASRPGVSYTFDNNGNELTKVDSTGTTSYTWDFENRLTSVTLPGSGGTVQFSYDPFGRSIKKSSSAGTSIFTYDLDNLVEETNSSGNVVSRYAQAESIDEPLAMLRASVTSYFEQDGLDTVTSLSNSSGTLAQTYTFNSFGKQTASSGSLVNPFQFTGREFDSETGLSFYRARYYSSGEGRFLSEDPLRFFSGVTNFFNYVGANPINLVDPFGLTCYCTYSQSTGHLKCVDAETGDVVAEANGYAGNGVGKNNPFFQTGNDTGPLPRGSYMMGRAHTSPNTGPLTIPLTYLGGDEPFPPNRSKDLMRIHGGRKGKPPGNASKGCIVTPNADPRKKIADGCGPGSLLTVVF